VFTELEVKLGDRVEEGSLVVLLEAAGADSEVKSAASIVK